jgi:hypothetical protein
LLLILCRRARLAAGRGLVSALVLLRRRLLAHAFVLLRCLARAALTGSRGLVRLTTGRGLVSALVLLLSSLVLLRLARALILLRGRLLLRRAALAATGRAAALARRGTALRAGTTLRAAHVRQSERCDGLIVDTAAHLEALSPLEGGDCRHGPRTHSAIDHNVEPSLLKHGLDLPDLIGAQVQRGRSATAAAQVCPAGGANGYDRYDLTAAVDDHDLVTHDEVLMSAPCRVDLDQRRRDIDDANARRHHCSDTDREVDVVHARHVAAGEDGLLDRRTLLLRQVHAAGLTRCGVASLTCRGAASLS